MKIAHINVFVWDLERSARFYERVFGLRRGFAATLEGDWISRVTGIENARAHCLFLEAPAGVARLELLQYETPMGEGVAANALPNTPGLRHLAFETDDLEALL